MTTTPCQACAVQQGTHQPAEAVHEIAEPKTQQPEALRLADKYEVDGFIGDYRFAQEHWCSQAAAELRRQHARIAELEAENVHKDRERRFAVAEALGLGNANYAWSYLHDQIKSLVKCEEEMIALRKQAAAQPAEGVPAATVANMPADPTEEMLEVLMAGEDRLRARHGDELTKKRAKERYQALLALAATQPADGAPAQEVQAAIDRFDAYFRSANGVPPNARVTVPTAERQELRAMLSTHHTQKGMDAQTIKHISALMELVRLQNAEHFADAHNAAVRHLRAIAAQAKQGGAA